MSLKRIFIIALTLWWPVPALASDIELVESSPAETVLDHPEIRNTKEVWREMIGRARKTLDIGQFYITARGDGAMSDVLREIRRAARRGVRVRILIDRKFYNTYPADADGLDKVQGIEVRKIDLNKLLHGVMHAKYMIVDGKETFLGSQNFDWRSLEQIEEIGVRIKNKEFARRVEEVFVVDWKVAKEEKLPPEDEGTDKKQDFIGLGDGVEVKPVFSPSRLTPSEFPNELEEILELIDGARKSVLIEVMNYSPSAYGKYDASIDNAIRRAAGRKIHVSLLVADWSQKDPHIQFAKALSLLPRIEVKIMSIPRLRKEYIPYARVQHAKFMVVDEDKAWIGSSNFEPSYFSNSRNVGVVIKGEKVVRLLRQIFLDSWTSPYAEYIEVSKEYRRPRIRQ